MKTFLSLLLTPIAMTLFSASAAAANSSPDEDLLRSLHAEHPRLIATQADWDRIKATRQSEPQLDKLVTRICDTARTMLPTAPSQRVMEGKRLLGVSREVVHRVLTLAFAWRMTGDDAFFQRAEAEMLSVASFSDWNPSHFLDVGEMTVAMAVGYDWLYERLSPDSRARIRQAIVDHGLKAGLTDPPQWWANAKMNWNQVCLGGLTLGALAVAEDEPDISRRMLEFAKAHVHNGLVPYAPDGVYPEGCSYWEYGTEYEVLLIAALRSALNTDWNLPASPGFLRSADFMLHSRGTTGVFFWFADGRMGNVPATPLYWFAHELNRPDLAAQQNLALQAELNSSKPLTDRFVTLIPLWWQGSPEAVPAETFWSGRSSNAFAAWRTAWNDPHALYFAIKAGGAKVSHGHMDAGTFILDWAGVRWADDLGMQDYFGLESRGLDLWNMKQDSDRWRIFRLGSFSHNTLTIGGQLHRADALSTLEKADASGAVIDLSPVFKGQASKVQRTVRWDGKNGSVQLLDELEGVTPGETVRWAMTTPAQIRIEGTTARLIQKGHELEVRFQSPNAVLRDESIEAPRHEFDSPNPGKRQLLLETKADENGKVRIETTFLVPPVR